MYSIESEGQVSVFSLFKKLNDYVCYISRSVSLLHIKSESYDDCNKRRDSQRKL